MAKETSDRSIAGGDILDAVIVGAGITGIYQLHRLRELGMRVRILEAGDGVGGTWFWNRYPGCRFDSESYSYGYFFSKLLRDEWAWSEEFAGQPETERYLNFAVDRLDLRPFIELNARVVSAEYEATTGTYIVSTADGRAFRARFLITAVGILSAPVFPAAPGLETFAGEWHHTARWPRREVDFRGKRVAVVGTGSSGVQIIPFVAQEAAHLTVFQRTANWCTPLNNAPITPEKMTWVRENFELIHQRCLSTPGGFIHRPRTEGAMEVDRAEREIYLESLYQRPGLTLLLNNFRDISTNRESNEVVTDFIARKIRSRVDDPRVAQMLTPDDHTFGMKRPPLENGYYEVFNQENVDLVSLKDEPIERFTPTGIRTAHRELPFDVIVLATGFEAATGSLLRMDIRGQDGLRLTDHWTQGPLTYLGLQTPGFPNLFIVGGPQSTTGNIPRSSEVEVDLVTRLLGHMASKGYAAVRASAAASNAWGEEVASTVRGTVLENARSWAFGSNIEGKPRTYLLWAGGVPGYRERCEAAFDDDYRGFEFA
ncbi:NAD(P)/FAD-dependent oxidoreductase [Aeromicrobium sp. YIM 150415]|uniref:flavin-containing monooxygenase n=1 Tax=Aeromicrobium sp. YIM 150415 TaxID=2803912 RepID=UPI0019642105|nr:NAD(P)/FAD-dependent oxidoreductase [Aeromicrobium sp. YIM 150415]MBM9464088.1 NAD(P)/FAD-dependent oxidoreductase [Aeromicrobium sp. YIM 150415]